MHVREGRGRELYRTKLWLHSRSDLPCLWRMGENTYSHLPCHWHINLSHLVPLVLSWPWVCETWQFTLCRWLMKACRSMGKWHLAKYVIMELSSHKEVVDVATYGGWDASSLAPCDWRFKALAARAWQLIWKWQCKNYTSISQSAPPLLTMY